MLENDQTDPPPPPPHTHTHTQTQTQTQSSVVSHTRLSSCLLAVFFTQLPSLPKSARLDAPGARNSILQLDDCRLRTRTPLLNTKKRSSGSEHSSVLAGQQFSFGSQEETAPYRMRLENGLATPQSPDTCSFLVHLCRCVHASLLKCALANRVFLSPASVLAMTQSPASVLRCRFA